MKKYLLLASASALSLTLTAPVFAQTDLTGTSALDDRLDDIEEDVTTELSRSEDAARFGNPEYKPGLSGSASLGFSGKTGNNESQDLAVGIRLRYSQGQFVQTIGAALDYSEADGQSTKEDVFAVYDANYYFNDSFYAFGLARLQTDGLADEAGEVRRDGFIGFGPGYRVVNTPDMTWRVQAGIGISYLQDGLRDSTTETGYLASSRFFYKINENVFVTNDTDVLKSDTALRANNDLGVNFKITDTMSTRVSYLTEYNDNRDIRTDNKLGVAIVFGF